MTDNRGGLKKEVERIFRVSDMLISMHSMLRDEYSRKSTNVDCSLFASSIILVALVFIDPLLLDWLPISAIVSRIILGVFALLTFFLSLVIFRVDWKSKSELHKHAAEVYSNIKLECQEILSNFEIASELDIQRLFIRYRYLGQICVAVPDNSFLRLKNKHKTKVAISKYLDNNLGTCLCLLKIRIWFISNFSTNSKHPLAKYLGEPSNKEEEL
jgi:hypothetical protein